MKKLKLKSLTIGALSLTILMGSCNSLKKLTREQKGAVVGAAGGAAAGAAIGAKSKNPAVYAIVGSAIGGVAGGIIGKYMDNQAKDLEEEIGEIAEIERIEEGIKVTMGSGILFDFDSYQLSANSINNIGELAQVLDDYESTDILIAGHTDNVGSDNYNQNLSEKRAAAVADLLVSKGVQRNRLVVRGYGEDSPAYSNETELGQDKNRRVELAIVANDDLKKEASKEADAMAFGSK
ncbi:OmpA family protein [Jiulongibacter sp. NS-SX5]|uniref:OmpA family protein n=1 Tax=Jiulongibacter sp. NS-SX5 TaxID=3463854 RepID=UPI00405A2C57